MFFILVFEQLLSVDVCVTCPPSAILHFEQFVYVPGVQPNLELDLRVSVHNHLCFASYLFVKHF